MEGSLLSSWFPSTTSPFIANAPMFGFTDAGLAAAVSKAGGLGIIGAGFDFSAQSAQIKALDSQLSKVRQLLGITNDKEPLPIGVGFITFKPAGFADNVIPVLAKHKVEGIWLAFPPSGADHAPMISAIRKARTESSWAVRIFVQVGDVKHAKEAVEQGADIIVAQGGDAGGHQWAHGGSVVSLVPEVRDLVRAIGKEGEVAVIAAGGIVDGRGLTAALVLGADGVVMGTRFVCSAECPAPAAVKQTMVSTTDGGRATIKSTAHDVFQSTAIWPQSYDGRAIIGKSYQDFKSGLSDDENIALYKDALAKGDESRRVIWAGSGVGVVKQILSAKDIVQGTQKEAREVVSLLTARL